MSLLAARSLGIEIAGRAICSDLDFHLEKGQCWGVLGGNGIGKTTLLRTLAGLRAPRCGQVLVENTALQDWDRKRLAQKLGMLFQDSVDIFPSSVLETALIGRFPYLPPFAPEGREDREIAMQALKDVALDDMATRTVDTLSGGERRRLALATLITQAPDIWLLDEPANHLDLHYQIHLLELIIARVKAAAGGLIMVLHDINLLARFCSHAMLMLAPEKIICGAVDTVVTTENLSQLYSHPVQKTQVNGREIYFPL